MEMEKLIQAMNEQFGNDRINGAIFLHFNKETGRLESISPLINLISVPDLIEKLLQTRDAVQALANDLADKSLKKGGQGN